MAGSLQFCPGAETHCALAAGMISRFYVIASGASAGFAITEHESAIGIASFFGDERTPSQAVVGV